jgi:hypothetical protein
MGRCTAATRLDSVIVLEDGPDFHTGAAEGVDMAGQGDRYETVSRQIRCSS